ncbi:serine/arginine repetitive matrix protein 2-like [Canna indica]|uniref:Serine/arginine repetitive matrix protein 2-like n=1 Tax=Canna indica TaxID=4628 RepID=A0AAQ3QLA5_9LILI|nr:serine/arginine repetitive matrix protein 2-like [Canna indica]
MASALVNTVAISPPPEAFPWLSPRISFSHEAADPPSASLPEARPEASPEDFEFRLHDDPVAMLPADELFSEGKLVPLQLAPPKHSAEIETEAEAEPRLAADIGLPEPPETRRKAEIVGTTDPYAFSPRAPRCTTRWRELLGLKRARVAKPGVQVAAATPAAAAAAALKNAGSRSSIKYLLHRHPKAASFDASLSLPLLRESDQESATTASRLSHSSSSSSSGPDHEDLARVSIDSNKSGHVPPRVRLARPRAAAASRGGPSPSRRAAEPAPPRGVSVDSPRMSSSGKIVFQGLERSSSSPGSFTGGPRPRPRGVERSYSANVRVAPILNVVPVCSLRGSSKPVSVFGLAHLFSPQQRKDRDSSSNRSELARSGRRQRRQELDRFSPK